MPCHIILAAAGYGWLGGRLSARALWGLALAATLVAMVTLGGMANLRLGQGKTATADFAQVVELADRLQPDLILGDYFVAGNLRLLRPDMQVGSLDAGLPDVAKNMTLLRFRAPTPPDAGWQLLDQGSLTVDYSGSTRKGTVVKWQLLRAAQVEN